MSRWCSEEGGGHSARYGARFVAHYCSGGHSDPLSPWIALFLHCTVEQGKHHLLFSRIAALVEKQNFF